MALDSDQLATLATELALPPYAGLNNTLAADALGLIDGSITRIRASMTGSEVLRQVVSTEFLAKTDEQKSHVLALGAVDDLDPTGLGKDLLVDIFGAESDTITALAAARVEDISRATDLGLPAVNHIDVARARRL